MAYLTFDKALLTNLDRSLSKEIIRTNRAGAYNSSTLVDCNTRKYHGQLVLPLPELGEDNYVLLSSLDETVIQHGAEFNLGLHKYGENTFNPNGHKYIREFESDVISTTTYRVGGVILRKERLLVSFEPRVLFRYTLLEAHSPTTLRFLPFLAFRSTNELTHENSLARTDYEACRNGASFQLYDAFPHLFVQISKQADYHHEPLWYKGIEYPKEQERGFAYKEDLLVPGYLEIPIKKGESVIVSAGITEVAPTSLKRMWDKETERRIDKNSMFAWLRNSASQFYKREGEQCHLLAGYPWFKASAREEFFSLPACTLGIGREEYWDAIMNKTALAEVRAFLETDYSRIRLQGMDEPDVLLWFIRAIQQYAEYHSLLEAAKLYGTFCADIVDFIRCQQHPRMFLHANGLLYVDGTQRPATWMNAMEDGRPITPRTGYVVEINALWYNALCFTAAVLRELNQLHEADLLEYQAGLTKKSFVDTFWNGYYLYDYVVDTYQNREVRPSQIWAAALPFTPLTRKQVQAVVNICTKELLTPRGLRTISPKSGEYRPVYIGGQLERDRNFHNGPVWPCTIAAYTRAYLNLYGHSGLGFLERMLVGFEVEMTELTVGTLNELYDGNPPYKGHGGMSYAPSVAAVVEVINMINEQKREDAQKEDTL